MGSPLLGKKEAIYSLPQNLTVGGSEGPEISGLCTGTSGQGPELPACTGKTAPNGWIWWGPI